LPRNIDLKIPAAQYSPAQSSNEKERHYVTESLSLTFNEGTIGNTL
jgi:hypothetical protein